MLIGTPSYVGLSSGSQALDCMLGSANLGTSVYFFIVTFRVARLILQTRKTLVGWSVSRPTETLASLFGGGGGGGGVCVWGRRRRRGGGRRVVVVVVIALVVVVVCGLW